MFEDLNGYAEQIITRYDTAIATLRLFLLQKRKVAMAISLKTDAIYNRLLPAYILPSTPNNCTLLL